jgi:predicted nucleic acid-binding protein
MKILLDTNVLSETTRQDANPRVIRRLNDPADDFFLSVVTIGEVVSGIMRMPAGAKKNALKAWLASIEQIYSRRLLGIDVEICRIWGELTAMHDARGRRLDAPDGLIAATALYHGMHMMTRNTKDFVHTGVLLINPWEE